MLERSKPSLLGILRSGQEIKRSNGSSTPGEVRNLGSILGSVGLFGDLDPVIGLDVRLIIGAALVIVPGGASLAAETFEAVVWEAGSLSERQ